MNAMASIFLVAFVVNAVQVELKWAKPDLQGQQLGVCRVEIKDVNVADGMLALDYSVMNISPYAICVCEDVRPGGKWVPKRNRRTGRSRLEWVRLKGAGDPQDAETRIVDDTLWIRLRGNLEGPSLDIMGLRCATPQYRLLRPGESFSGTVVCSLPVEYDSPVYPFGAVVGQRVSVDVKRIVLEVGFLTDYRAEELFPGKEGQMRPAPLGNETVIQDFEDILNGPDMWKYMRGELDPNSTEYAAITVGLDERMRTLSPPEPVAGDPKAVRIVDHHPDVEKEKWILTTVDNVEIPCITFIDDKAEIRRNAARFPKVPQGL